VEQLLSPGDFDKSQNIKIYITYFKNNDAHDEDAEYVEKGE
jgi:hypothetical protein